MRSIGGYTLLTRLGSGHLGDVFYAQHPDATDASDPLAIKVVRPDLVEDLKFSRLLLAEAPAAIAFAHPAAADVRAIDRDRNDAFVAMAYTAGQPLSLLIQRARVENDKVDHRLIAWIGSELASALAAAHEIPWFAGAPAMMAHGALAPRGVLLAYDGRVKLLGLGLGRCRATVPMTLARLPYAAPEVLKGGDPTPRADIFSLGTLLYEAFSGRNIFRRANEEQTKAAVIDGNVPPLNSTNLDVDPSIGDLIAQMMAPRIDARPASMVEVRTALAAAAGSGGHVDALALRLKKAFREEREASERMIEAAHRAQASAPPKPRVQSGIGPIAQPLAEDEDDDFDIAEGTPVAEEDDTPAEQVALNRDDTPVVSGPPPILEDAPPIPGSPAIPPPPPPRSASGPRIGSARPTPRIGTLETPVIMTPPPSDPDMQVQVKMPATGPDTFGPTEDIAPEHTTQDPALRERVARYRVEAVIARSATVVTFLAKDPNVGRSVVVKAMDPSFSSDARLTRAEWVRLFKREARVAGRLAHPNLPAVLDAGRDRDVYFVVYEHIAGESLAKAIQREALISQRRVREIVVAVAEALAHMHEMGVVHCDVRPSNVMLEEGGRVRLVDLSMASVIGEPPHPLLASNAMALSPEYLDGHGYTASSDQFALGMLVYQMLVGSRPFKGVDDAQLVAAIRSVDPTPPEQVESYVNPILSEMCMRMLEKDPTRRYENCGAIASRLSGSQIPRTQSDISLPEASTTDRNVAVAARVSVESIASAFVAVCERVSTLTTQPFADGAAEPAEAARAVARRLGTDETTETLAVLAASLSDLSNRLLVSVGSEEMAPLRPPELAPVFDAMHQLEMATEPDESRPLAAEIAYVVGAYYGATRPRGIRTRVSPRRAVLALKDVAEPRVRPGLVEAFVEFLRETISALDLSPAAADAPRVLVAGSVSSDALLHALEFDGYVVEEATDGHEAWEKLRHHGYRGAVVDAGLPGRDGVSLVKLCRAHPDTAEVRFVLVGNGSEMDNLDPDPTVRLAAADIAVDDLRMAVKRLLEA